MRSVLFGRPRRCADSLRGSGTAPRRRRPAPCVKRLEDRLVPSGLPFLVKDINVQHLLVGPSDMLAIGGTAFFSADDGIHGTALFKSDGTAKGTVLLQDISPGGA